MITISKEKYGTADHQEINQYTLQNGNGTVVKLINYGGAITNILFADKNGKPTDIALGFDSLEEYAGPDNPHFGCITGRFANRITKGRFEIDGQQYQVTVNNNGNTLHGGKSGFNRKIWSAEIVNGTKVKMTYTSKDGEEGFPGNCSVEVTYILSDDDSLRIDYAATSDAPTPVNITNHSYFNLSGGIDDTVIDHEIWINADQFVPVNEEFLPTGKLAPVAGTEMDLTSPTRVGDHIDEIPGGGYDHTYVLNNSPAGKSQAGVYHKGTGIYLELETTEPGVQFYTGNMLTGKLVGKKRSVYARRGGFCLEAQHFPDSPNQPSFPNTILRPGETYQQTTIYRLSVK